MADFEQMYLELYGSINEAMEHLVSGKPTEAMLCLLEGQIRTVSQILSEPAEAIPSSCDIC